MKKFLLSLCCFVYAFIVYAGPVSEQQALTKASQFMPGKGFVLAKPSAKKNLAVAHLITFSMQKAMPVL